MNDVEAAFSCSCSSRCATLWRSAHSSVWLFLGVITLYLSKPNFSLFFSSSVHQAGISFGNLGILFSCIIILFGALSCVQPLNEENRSSAFQMRSSLIMSLLNYEYRLSALNEAGLWAGGNKQQNEGYYFSWCISSSHCAFFLYLHIKLDFFLNCKLSDSWLFSYNSTSLVVLLLHWNLPT